MSFKRLTATILALFVVLTLAACFQHTFTVGEGAPTGEIVYKHWHHHWLFGLIRPKLQREVALAKFCPSGNATIHEEVTFLNGLIDVLIGVIYSPTTVTIQCDDGTMAELELSAEEVSALVHDPLFLQAVEEVAPDRLAEARTALATELASSQEVVAGP